MRNKIENNQTFEKPRHCLNDEKPKDHVPMISYKWKKRNELRLNLESCPNDKKRVEQINELR